MVTRPAWEQLGQCLATALAIMAAAAAAGMKMMMLVAAMAPAAPAAAALQSTTAAGKQPGRFCHVREILRKMLNHCLKDHTLGALQSW
jgi:hypothetical protein